MGKEIKAKENDTIKFEEVWDMYAQVEKGKKGKVRVNANAFMPNKLRNTDAIKLHSEAKGQKARENIRNRTTTVTQRARPEKMKRWSK
ncbi:hypothetical protein F0266_09365 [Vibrio coralliilyticus]|uniref:hypothetical protein n=1 Tax=Vibrio coralliilyticus TaxID=190893 RepID=UPI00148B791E|nr:hypothetical protein [Vibrio coralliilyticus]NOH53141.1 hypothetical protein [Vibrio coralliilyticus]